MEMMKMDISTIGHSCGAGETYPTSLKTDETQLKKHLSL